MKNNTKEPFVPLETELNKNINESFSRLVTSASALCALELVKGYGLPDNKGKTASSEEVRDYVKEQTKLIATQLGAIYTPLFQGLVNAMTSQGKTLALTSYRQAMN